VTLVDQSARLWSTNVGSGRTGQGAPPRAQLVEVREVALAPDVHVGKVVDAERREAPLEHRVGATPRAVGGAPEEAAFDDQRHARPALSPGDFGRTKSARGRDGRVARHILEIACRA